jgi:hypothetical protein
VPKLKNKLVEQDYDATSENAQSGKAIGIQLQSITTGIQGNIGTLESTVAELKDSLDNFKPSPSFIASTEAPANTSVLWIDASEDGGLKYHNGTDWVTVPVRFS